MVGRPTTYKGGRLPVTFYLDAPEHTLSSKDRKSGQFTHKMAALYAAYYGAHSERERILRAIEDKEQQMGRLQEDVHTLRVQLERTTNAATEARVRENLVQEFRKRCQTIKGRRDGYRNWLNRERADVQAIGWPTAVHVFEEVTGDKVTW